MTEVKRKRGRPKKGEEIKKSAQEDIKVPKKTGAQYGNKNAEKWTEEEALKVGVELLEWIGTPGPREVTKDGFLTYPNMFFTKFLKERKLCYSLISDLTKKFDSFSSLIKKCKEIQKDLLMENALNNKTNSTFTMFLLKCNYGMMEAREKAETVVETVKYNIKKEDIKKIKDEFDSDY